MKYKIEKETFLFLNNINKFLYNILLKINSLTNYVTIEKSVKNNVIEEDENMCSYI